MSRWLKSVNTLLEQLDGQVENVVEEREQNLSLEEDDLETMGLESILAKRGLTSPGDSDDGKLPPTDDKKEVENEPLPAQVLFPREDTEPLDKQTDETKVEDASQPVAEEDVQVSLGEGSPAVVAESATDTPNVEADDKDSDDLHANKKDEAIQEDVDGSAPKKEEGEPPKDELTAADAPTEDAPSGPVSEIKEEKEDENQETPPAPPTDSEAPAMVDAKPPGTPPPPAIKVTTQTPAATKGPSTPPSTHSTAAMEARQAQKEARTLRRHVVSLNKQLEAAEAEIQAQRNELERAAERMEKDRIRTKEEKEKEKTRHADEVKALKSQHDLAIKEQKKRMEDQLADARKQLKELEDRRTQEGGDWNKELAGAIEREHDMIRKVSALEDEKSVLLSQISTLQSQQEALGNRLESLSHTADLAMERERDAEDRLDAALSLHARQLSQRQSREAELERTVSELGAALVVARNRELSRLKAAETGEGKDDEEKGSSSLKDRLHAAEEELENIGAQLHLEQQRNQTLRQELQEISKERSEETAAAHIKLLQYEREAADMNIELARLRSASKKDQSEERTIADAKLDQAEQANQIKSLSEEVLRMREKSSSYTSEIAALKSRLKSAVDRANRAEEAAAEAENERDKYDVMERAPSSGNYMRKRGGRKEPASIRNAMRLNPGQGQNSERIGRAIDVVDSFSVSTGRYLRSNPLARGAFIAYLLLLHFWTFALLVYHAHSFEPIHGDFGAGQNQAHGPHALMQDQNVALQKNP